MRKHLPEVAGALPSVDADDVIAAPPAQADIVPETPGVWDDGADQCEKLAKAFGHAGEFHRAFEHLLYLRAIREPYTEAEQNVFDWINHICDGGFWTQHRHGREADRVKSIAEMRTEYRAARSAGDSDAMERIAGTLRRFAATTQWASPRRTDPLLIALSAAKRALGTKQTRLECVQGLLAKTYSKKDETIIHYCSQLPEGHLARPVSFPDGSWTRYEVSRDAWVALTLELQAELPLLEKEIAELQAKADSAEKAFDEHERRLLDCYLPK